MGVQWLWPLRCARDPRPNGRGYHGSASVGGAGESRGGFMGAAAGEEAARAKTG